MNDPGLAELDPILSHIVGGWVFAHLILVAVLARSANFDGSPSLCRRIRFSAAFFDSNPPPPLTRSPLRVKADPKANGVLDTAYCCRAHGIKLPTELDDPNVLRKLESAVVHEWWVYLAFAPSLEFDSDPKVSPAGLTAMQTPSSGNSRLG